MVLGLRSKSRKVASIQVDYIIHLQEIKPWPPMQSLRSLRSVVLQWENGDRSSGFTNPVTPSTSEGRIEFNESFKLHATLTKAASTRGSGTIPFHKNLLELNLYEPKKDKTAKGQLVASASVDLAEHAIVEEAATFGVSLNYKKSYRNAANSMLYVRIQPYDKEGSTGSSRDSVSKEASMDRDGTESVSSLMTGEYVEEAEIASFTDDDVSSSHSFMNRNCPSPGKQTADENVVETIKKREGLDNTFDSSSQKSPILPERLDTGESIVSSSRKLVLANTDHKPEVKQEGHHVSNEVASVRHEHEMMVNGAHKMTAEQSGAVTEIKSSASSLDNRPSDMIEELVYSPVLRPRFRRNSTTRKALPNETTTVGQRLVSENANVKSDVTKSTKSSSRSNSESLGGNKYLANDQPKEDVKEIDVKEDVHDGNQETSNQLNLESMNNKNNKSDNRVRELELKVKMLEGELREAAAVEVALYCVVAAHGSSANKVHTPARRLSRLYIHASKHWSRERKGSAARSAVSGLFLAAKACGNDVPRLTFWLSNSVVLRAILAQSIAHSADHPSSGLKKRTTLKWESMQKKEFSITEDIGDWEDPYTFMTALERIESWIFSRIVESIWWQTFTPHMQIIKESSDTMGQSKKNYASRPSLGDQKQANSSTEIWKRAFKDACERLCPVRAGGNECGCLPMLSRLVMEHCVARLDVAMFNAILRESDDDIPNNPLSDPISDSKVLPIPSGKLSFGAGAQLKNAIGNWSRWLTDLFGMDADDNACDENEIEIDRHNVATPFMSFRLLYALSDLLMLPKDMLLERNVRKEVCPTFSESIIKRILNGFQPDEFCPDPITEAVLEALDSEEPLDNEDEGIRNFPCDASPVVYSSPSMDLIESIIGDVLNPSTLRRSGSSVVRKCHTSDDELEELDSPLNSVIIEKATPTGQSNRTAIGRTVRYKLLREVWRDEN